MAQTKKASKKATTARKRRPTREETDQWAKYEKRVRDVIIFVLGIAGIVNEFWIETEPRLPVLLAGFALIGIPLTLYADEQRRLNR